MIFFKKQLKKAFDYIADDFDQTRKYQWKDFKFLENYLKILKNQKILDLGCGNGRANNFFKRFKLQYTGLDSSKNLLAKAKQNFPQEKFIYGQMEKKIPFKNKSFAAISAIASFHHLFNAKDRQKCLQEIHRVLKPNGLLMMTVWNMQQEKFNTIRKKALLRSILCPFWEKNDLIVPFGKKKIPRYYYAFSPQNLKKILHDNFFEIKEIIFCQNGQKVPLNKAFNIAVIAQKKTRIYLDKIPFDLISKKEIFKKLSNLALGKKQSMVFTPNPEMFLEAKKNKDFRKILQKADLSLIDGVGIIWAFKNQGKNIFLTIFSLIKFLFSSKKIGPLERITGSWTFKKFCQQVNHDKNNQKEKIKVFLLGGKKGIAKKCLQIFKQKNPHFIASGYDEGSKDKKDEKRICQKINSSSANVLFVAFGAPFQEIWINRNLKKIPHIKLAMGVGGSFDFTAGKIKRSPQIFQFLGLEWLYRLIRQPQRIKRIFNATFGFLKYISNLTKRSNRSGKSFCA